MITLEEITYNSLMPWSCMNNEDFLFTEICAQLSAVNDFNLSTYFTRLGQIIKEMGMKPLAEVTEEWKSFASTCCLIPDGLYKDLARFRHPNHKVGFYARLTSSCAFADLQLLEQDFLIHPDPNYKVYKLQTLCKRLERIISAANPETEHSEENLIIIKLTKIIAILMYLDLIVKYGRVMHLEKLKLTPDAVFEELAKVSMISRTAVRIAKQMAALYRPYFRSGPAAYRDVDILAQATVNKYKKAISPNQTNAGSMETAGAPKYQAVENKPDKTDDKAEERIIGTGEAMRILGCSTSTLKRWRDNGKIKYYQPHAEAHCKYRLSDVEAMVEIRRSEKRDGG